MKTVYSARTVTETRFVCSLLQDEGIEATLDRESLAGIAGDIPADETWPRVQVEDSDAERAEAIVEAFLHDRTAATGPSWTCACGEVHEPQFSECWSCGAPRA